MLLVISGCCQLSSTAVGGEIGRGVFVSNAVTVLWTITKSTMQQPVYYLKTEYTETVLVAVMSPQIYYRFHRTPATRFHVEPQLPDLKTSSLAARRLFGLERLFEEICAEQVQAKPSSFPWADIVRLGKAAS
jgi:hypothetical protein